MSRIKSRLAELDLTLPEPAGPAANYVPYVVSGAFVFISGQLSAGPSGLMTGKLGRDLDAVQGAAAARACGLHLLAQLNAALNGDLDRVRRVVKLAGFVNCTEDFAAQPQVVNGASDLMVAVFGDAGRHARAALGAPSLPLNAAVEIDGLFEIA
jgi:enamine deaminase RidA (YjgF/YER057c/UK114 family)